jgi:hypothetical protein
MSLGVTEKKDATDAECPPRPLVFMISGVVLSTSTRLTLNVLLLLLFLLLLRASA